jgi:hypothetical protein
MAVTHARLYWRVAEGHDGQLTVKAMSLAMPRAARVIRRDMAPVQELIDSGRMSRTVTVYIDTAYVGMSNRSHHAMAFISVVYDTAATTPLTTYLLLAVEEFPFAKIINDIIERDTDRTVAHVCAQTILNLSRMYKGFFTRYLLFPEANSMDMRRFWEYVNLGLDAERSHHSCLRDVELRTSIIRVASAVTTVGTSVRGELEVVSAGGGNSSTLLRAMHGQHFPLADDGSGQAACRRLRSYEKMKQDRFHPYLERPNIAMHRRADVPVNMRYRIGYKLTGNKLVDTCEFYDIYNGAKNSAWRVCC